MRNISLSTILEQLDQLLHHETKALNEERWIALEALLRQKERWLKALGEKLDGRDQTVPALQKNLEKLYAHQKNNEARLKGHRQKMIEDHRTDRQNHEAHRKYRRVMGEGKAA